jgi:hypothetical protein
MAMSDAGDEEQSSLVTSPKDTDFEPIKGKKIFFAPTGNEETFIDHDCTLDDEGYPLYPNRRTIFVKTPEMTIQNFGSVGFPKTSNVEWRADKSWKMTRIFCLGAMLCSEPGCQWVGSPPTGKNAIADYLARFINLVAFFICFSPSLSF